MLPRALKPGVEALREMVSRDLKRGDDEVGNGALGPDNEKFKLLASIPTLCDDNAATV